MHYFMSQLVLTFTIYVFFKIAIPFLLNQTSYCGNILILLSTRYFIVRHWCLTRKVCKTINLLHNKKQKLCHIFDVEFRQSSKAFGNLRAQWQRDAVWGVKKQIWFSHLDFQYSLKCNSMINGFKKMLIGRHIWFFYINIPTNEHGLSVEGQLTWGKRGPPCEESTEWLCCKTADICGAGSHPEGPRQHKL